jgi:hypothetical protein
MYCIHVEEKRNVDKFTLEVWRGETACETKDKWEDYVQINLKQLAFEGIIRQDNVAQGSVQ